MDRHIVHLDLDTFFVSVARLERPELIGKPVVVGGLSDRGVVASCSYEARAFGVHSAMPMRLAMQLCPQAIQVKGDYDQFEKKSRQVTEVIQHYAPVVEKASIDEHYLDLTGMDKYFGCMKWMQELRQKIIKETRLPISFGLSLNKTVSKIATGQGKPNGEENVEKGTELGFLAPLSIRKIPMIGDKSYRLLRNMGVDKIGVIQQMPAELMEHAMGENGLTIWKKANAIDNSPVVPYSERKSISSETTFDKDTTDMLLLRRTIVTMVNNLCFDLRKEHRLASTIAIKIRYSNWDTHLQQQKIFYTSADHILAEKALALFEKLYSRRMLVRLIGVKLSGLVSGHYQIDLFNDTERLVRLYQAMDSVRLRFGSEKLMKAISLGYKDKRA